MDFWAFGSPQTGGWAPGNISGTEYSEVAGSCYSPINSRLNPSINGVLMEMSFGSYHPGGAYFVFGDGAVKFLSENIDLNTYRALGSRAKSEMVSVPE
jgi:prepilin-type processing-associated H-X9-DG protein